MAPAEWLRRRHLLPTHTSRVQISGGFVIMRTRSLTTATATLLTAGMTQKLRQVVVAEVKWWREWLESPNFASVVLLLMYFFILWSPFFSQNVFRDGVFVGLCFCWPSISSFFLNENFFIVWNHSSYSSIVCLHSAVWCVYPLCLIVYFNNVLIIFCNGLSSSNFISEFIFCCW